MRVDWGSRKIFFSSSWSFWIFDFNSWRESKKLRSLVEVIRSNPKRISEISAKVCGWKNVKSKEHTGLPFSCKYRGEVDIFEEMTNLVIYTPEIGVKTYKVD